MEDGPIPRHERTWRHPSELSAPTVAYVEPTVRGGHLSALAIGAVVALTAVGMLIAFNPTPSGTAAVSATTIAPVRSGALHPAGTGGVGLQSHGGRATALHATPLRAAFDPTTVVAAHAPRWYETVLVITDTAVYPAFWREVLHDGGPDGAVVVNMHGQVVAHCDAAAVHVVAGVTTE